MPRKSSEKDSGAEPPPVKSIGGSVSSGGKGSKTKSKGKSGSSVASASVRTKPRKGATIAGRGIARGGGFSTASNDQLTVDGSLDYEEDHPDLADLEARLTEEVDEEFFVEPRKFHTLHRVIDVLGMQLADEMSEMPGEETKSHTRLAQLERNPAYRALKHQQTTVEEAIEHLALIHCADLNGSVVQVGRVARQFHDAVSKVRSIRKQVREIQETLGAGQAPPQGAQQGGQGNKQNQQQQSGQASNAAAASAASAMSLRELWLKKLECEAVLGLLDKLDRIRAAPMQFDMHLQQTRIGAAVIGLSQALDTMFSDDVAQVQALHKIMEQLMIRKQTAEELVWELLVDVLFLRTGNGLAYILATTKPGRNLPLSLASRQIMSSTTRSLAVSTKTGQNSGSNDNNRNSANNMNSNASVVSTESKQKQNQQQQVANRFSSHDEAFYDSTIMMKNPFFNERMRFALDRDLELDQDVELLEEELHDDINDDAIDEDEYLEQQQEQDGNHKSSSPNKPPAISKPKSSTATASTVTSGTSGNSFIKNMMIPLQMLEAEFDLEADERRCLEEISLVCGTTVRKKSKNLKSGGAGGAGGDPGNTALSNSSSHGRPSGRQTMAGHAATSGAAAGMPRPHYADHVLALRTLVECLARLKRLDDMERVLSDVLDHELTTLRQREQGRTFCRLEAGKKLTKRGTGKVSRNVILYAGADGNSATDLTEFRRHLHGLLSAFGCVMIRLSHLAQILRHRLASEKTGHSAYAVPSAALQSVLSSAKAIMERELTIFVKACLKEPDPIPDVMPTAQAQNRYTSYTSRFRIGTGMTTFSKNANAIVAAPNKYETGLFSLGILDDPANEKADESKTLTASASRSNTIEMMSPKFVTDVLFPKTANATGSVAGPQIRHALFFRKSLAKWKTANDLLRTELATATGEDTSLPSYNEVYQEPALKFLDTVIQKDLLPMLQEEAVNGTVKALERGDAFDPVLDRNVYARANSNEPQDVDMCKACDALYTATAPLFLALHRLPRGGDMYLPLVAVLEHVVLTFISRIKQQVGRICNDKTALQLLMDGTGGGGGKSSISFGTLMERRKAYAQLLLAYADGDLLDVADETAAASGGLLQPITPPPLDTPKGGEGPKGTSIPAVGGGVVDELDLMGGVEKEESQLNLELGYVKPYLEFGKRERDRACGVITLCTDEGLMKAACLAHSLLKLASLLDSRLKIRAAGSSAAAAFSGGGGATTKILPSTRALREAIKTIQANGLKLAKFCRADILMQAVTRLSKVCMSSTIVARDAVRIPSSVNDLGEYMTAASDNLREAAGNAVTAYAFSSLEQYIPLCLIQTVRILAAGEGIIQRAPLSMNGIEALDRSGSVLYRDLKGATSFDNSFWDMELAAVSFERSASFIQMMELEMAELEAYYQENRDDFSEADFKLMFAMDGPRRKGDVGRLHMVMKRMGNR